jgi:hypothetical protein
VAEHANIVGHFFVDNAGLVGIMSARFQTQHYSLILALRMSKIAPGHDNLSIAVKGI